LEDLRWNGLISAVGSYVSGADLERVSTRDFQRYDDSGVNWRVIDGYGAVQSLRRGSITLPKLRIALGIQADDEPNRWSVASVPKQFAES
jgi:hypothetical protein